MSHTNRVFITGMSALTSTGATADDTWSAVLAGESGLGEIRQWELPTWSNRLGGELKHYNPASMLPDRKLMKVISRQDVLGINAAMQAVDHSQLIPYRDAVGADAPDWLASFQDDTGVYVGSPGNKYLQQYDFLPLIAKTKGDMQEFAKHLFSEVHPMWLLRILPNNVLAYTGITYGFKGANHNITNHAVSGMQAIIEAYHAIACGQISRAVVVAYDVGTEPQALYYYDKLGVLSDRNLNPFDQHHDGTVLAEGASALVLESEASARDRSALCYAEVTGGSSTTEAAGLFSIEAEGTQLQRLMSLALERQQLYAGDIGLVVAHGNGNPKSDISEAQAIHALFGNHDVPVTAFKWSMGHTLCASGVLDTVLGVYSLRNQCIPGIANLTELAPDCRAMNASRETRPLRDHKQHALIINRGFGSMNTCLVIKACDEFV
ncbi:MAG: beta-ketoacyl synthase N-terminal-like domain-containing protein [Legionellaceae bacterium]|nr:beta-ketoacyl synthase N-terminal-like domain-containing protein [Legionellaceae bacterium]